MTAETVIAEPWSARWQPPSPALVRGTVVLPGRGALWSVPAAIESTVER